MIFFIFNKFVPRGFYDDFLDLLLQSLQGQITEACHLRSCFYNSFAYHYGFAKTTFDTTLIFAGKKSPHLDPWKICFGRGKNLKSGSGDIPRPRIWEAARSWGTRIRILKRKMFKGGGVRT